MKPIHPDAWVFPVMSEEEYTRFADSIEREGLLQPITLLDGQVLDGRHRQRACNERGIELRYVEWDPSCGVTPLEWVIAMNLHRRQLAVSQRAALAAEVHDRLIEAARTRRAASLTRGEGGRFTASGQMAANGERDRKNEPCEIAAGQFGVSVRSVERAKQIRSGSTESFERVKSGDLSLQAALREAGILEDRAKAIPRPKSRRDLALRDALLPARRYLKDWDPSWLSGVTPAQARRLLAQVQEVDAALFEVERALEARTVVSRALR